MLYELKRTDNPMYITECTWAIGQGQVRFSKFTSCIGVIAVLDTDEVLAVHLTAYDAHDVPFSSEAVAQVIDILEPYRQRTICTVLAGFEDIFLAFQAGYQLLDSYLKARGVGKINFNEDGIYRFRVHNKEMKIAELQQNGNVEIARVLSDGLFERARLSGKNLWEYRYYDLKCDIEVMVYKLSHLLQAMKPGQDTAELSRLLQQATQLAGSGRLSEAMNKLATVDEAINRFIHTDTHQPQYQISLTEITVMHRESRKQYDVITAALHSSDYAYHPEGKLNDPMEKPFDTLKREEAESYRKQ